MAVDVFDDGLQSLTAELPGTPSISGSVSATSALGGHRQVLVKAFSGTGRATVEIDQKDNDLFTFSEDANLTDTGPSFGTEPLATTRLVNPTGLGGVDLTGGGVQNSFVLAIKDTDRQSIQTITVYSDATHASQATISLPRSKGNTTQYIAFSDFAAMPGLSPANFSDVGAITFTVTRDPTEVPGWDYSLYSIGTLGPTVFSSDFSFVVSPSMRLVKQTNDWNSDTPPGRLLPVGSAVTWTYLVTNEGNESLADVAVTDDQPGVNPVPVLDGGFNVGDTNTNNLLEPGEVWRFTASGLAIADQYVNVGTATGIGAVSAAALQAEDTDFYFGVQSIIDIEKATNGLDADTPTGPVVIATSTVTWTYVVTNPGNVPLSSVAVTDDNGTPSSPADDFTPAFVEGDGNGNGQLDPGETWLYRATGTAQIGLYGNAATATGIDPIGQRPSDMDPSHYFGVPKNPIFSKQSHHRARPRQGSQHAADGQGAHPDGNCRSRASWPTVNLHGRHTRRRRRT